MTFKQKFICQNGPFPVNFEQERSAINQKINALIRSCHPNEWNQRSISPLYYIESMRQVYGITAQQLSQFANFFLKLLKEPNIEVDAMIIITKSLNRIRQYKINSNKMIEVDNIFFLTYIKDLIDKGCKYCLKSMDSFVDQFMITIRLFSEYGQDLTGQVLDLAVTKRQNKFIALFIRAVKKEQNGQLILEKLFSESNLWQRDGSFYFIISQITKKFPKIDYSPYLPTLFHEIIKIITTIIDPSSEDDIRKLVISDSSLGLPPILKSVANILVNLLRPVTEPGWQVVWTCIERIFSLISSTLDHFRETQYMNDFLIFLKQFAKAFSTRYYRQRKVDEITNDHYIEHTCGEPKSQIVLNQDYCKLFTDLWPEMIPQLLYLEDNDVRVSKILNELVLFNPEKFLLMTLSEILNFLDKDLTIVSTFSSKMTILFLSEFVLEKYTGEHEMTVLFQCCSKLLVSMEKLGISENLDILELVMRCYLYLTDEALDSVLVQDLTSDIIQIILQNINAMSINLESGDSDEAQIYTDLRNIYFPFILRLHPEQIKEINDKILFKIQNNIPEHRQAYEFLVVALSYMDKTLPTKILQFVYRQIITINKDKNSKGESYYAILPAHSQYILSTNNQEHLRWYISMLQCSLQYHPQNIIKNWEKLQIILMCIFRQQQKNNIFEWGLDFLFNMLLNLCNIHLPSQQFCNRSNYSYQTLKDIKWKKTGQAEIDLIIKIKTIFFDNLQQFIHNKYDDVILKGSPTTTKIQSGSIIKIPKEIEDITAKESQSFVIDALLSSDAIPTADDLNEKKIIYKIISLQYTVFSAIQQRSPYIPNLQSLQSIKQFFIPGLPSFRRQVIPYLNYLKQLLCHYRILADPNMIKTFHLLWREAHDQLYFSSSLAETTQKLHPYFHSSMHRKKQLFSNPYFIITEIYINVFQRVELHSYLQPVAYLNNPQYLSDIIQYTFCNSLDTAFKSPVPLSIDIHKQCHKQIVNLCRLKFSQQYEYSYIRKYIDAADKTQKQRYLQAIRSLILGIKKNQGIFMMGCCYRDQILWAQVIQILDAYPHLQKKADKSIIIDVIYLIIIFSVDSKGSLTYIQGDEKQNQMRLGQIKALIEFLKSSLFQENKNIFEKNKLLLAVLIFCFQELVPFDDHLHIQIFNLAVTMSISENDYDQMNIGKTLLYRYMNRMLKSKLVKKTIENKPIKRSYSQYLLYRNLGGQAKQETLQPAQWIKSEKLDNYFYPLKELKTVTINKLDPEIMLEKNIQNFLTNEKQLRALLNSFKNDLDLKLDDHNEELNFDIEDEPKKVSHNGHKLLNFIFDSNPSKLDVFSSFVDNFANSPGIFYHKIYRKMFLMGDQSTLQIHKQMVTDNYHQCEKQEKRLRQFIMVQLLPHLIDDEQYINFFSSELATCSNQQFSRLNSCLLVVFCIDWRINLKIYHKITNNIKESKGRIGLRHLEVLNNFILCTGRFGRKQAVAGIEDILKGIQEGTDQISDLIVSMLVSCFIIPINVSLFKDWVEEPLEKLISESRITQISQEAGYQIEESLILFIDKVISQCQKEKQLESKNLKTYSKIANKILSSITVYRFNNPFYSLLKKTILFFLNKIPGLVDEENNYDDEIVSQLRNSQYPEPIYNDLMSHILANLSLNKINVIKKKLKFIEGVSINRFFVNGNIVFPPILGNSQCSNGHQVQNQKQKQKDIYIEHIIAISNIARILKPSELTEQAQKLLAKQNNKKINVHMMMALLLAAGTRPFQWREPLLNEIVQHKKQKVVKEFVSYWWKGRSPQTEDEQRLYMLVRSVENPYTYFA